MPRRGAKREHVGLDTVQAQLHERGYAVVPRAIPDNILRETIAAIENLDVGVRRRGNGDAIYAARNLLARAPDVRRCAEHAVVCEHAHNVLGGGAFITRAILFDKNPGANWSVPWHQDTSIAVKAQPCGQTPGFGPWSIKDGVPHVQPPASVLESMLTVRIHLDPSGESNAPLRVIPGTHRTGILKAEAIEIARVERGAVSCIVPAGGLLLMRPLLLHASSSASNPGHRRVIHLEWAAGNLPHGLDWNRA